MLSKGREVNEKAWGPGKTTFRLQSTSILDLWYLWISFFQKLAKIGSRLMLQSHISKLHSLQLHLSGWMKRSERFFSVSVLTAAASYKQLASSVKPSKRHSWECDLRLPIGGGRWQSFAKFQVANSLRRQHYNEGHLNFVNWRPK